MHASLPFTVLKLVLQSLQGSSAVLFQVVHASLPFTVLKLVNVNGATVFGIKSVVHASLPFTVLKLVPESFHDNLLLSHSRACLLTVYGFETRTC